MAATHYFTNLISADSHVMEPYETWWKALGPKFGDRTPRLLDTDATRYYRVLMGPYALRAAAAARSEMMTRLGYPVVIMEDWRP